MRRLVQCIALGAATVALATAVWLDYGAFTALKRTAVAYLIAYFLAGGLGLVTRAALAAVRDPDPEPEPDPKTTRSKRRRRTVPNPGAPAAPAPDPAEEASVAPEAVEAG